MNGHPIKNMAKKMEECRITGTRDISLLEVSLCCWCNGRVVKGVECNTVTTSSVIYISHGHIYHPGSYPGYFMSSFHLYISFDTLRDLACL